MSSSNSEDREQVAALLTTYTKGGAEGLNEIRMFLSSRSPDPELLEWLCMGFYTNGLYRECLEVCDEVLKADADNIKSTFYRANSMFHLGDQEGARIGWEKVVEMAPDTPLAHKARERLSGKRLPRRVDPSGAAL